MSFESFLATAAIRKAAFYSFGWFMETRYKEIFRISWERGHGENNKVQSDWIDIFKKSKNVPKNIYISAGDLYLMAPLLEEISKINECRKCIDKIYIKKISEELFKYLTNESKPFLPVINKGMKDQYEYNLDILKRVYGEDKIFEREWPRLPSYAGVLYGDYLHYHPWEVSVKGELNHRTKTCFMKRENDIEFYEEYERLIKNGFLEGQA